MNSISGNNDQQIKFLFARLREQLEQQKKQREMSMMAESSSAESSSDDEDSSHCGSIKKNTINRRCAQSSCTDEKKPSSTPQDVNSEVRSPPISLPFVTFKEDDCDEAEKLARAKRIEVIMRLSAEAKAKEAERKRVASIRPLSWDKPTFDYPSSSSSATTTTADAAPDVPPKAPSPTLGKRKSRQDGFSRNSYSPYFASSRIATEDEIQALVDFADEYFPSGKRSRSFDKKGGDDQKS